jgi:hypothetical protein
VLVGLDCGDDPGAWAGLGFAVVGGVARVGPVAVRLDGRGGGLRGWALAESDATVVAGIPTTPDAPPAGRGARELDHVVLVCADLDRTVGELVAAGGDERRRVELHAPMAFVRMGEVIVEVVGREGVTPRLWGLVAVVEDLATLPADLVGEPRAAVQPGRTIVTARPQAGLETALAFMTPRVRTR